MPERPDLPRAVTDLVPQGLITQVLGHVPAEGYAGGLAWLPTVPRLVAELVEQWRLEVTGPATHGYAALVLPVETPGGPAVLKIAWPHPEGRDEHRTLGLWGGHGAVRLLAADPSRWALLLERLDPRDLNGPPVSVLDSCEQIGRLAALLDRPAPPWTSLSASDHLATLVADLDALRAGDRARSLPRALLERGRSLATDLATEPGIDARLVHSDLHQENVLWRPDPGEWVAIDPQTIAADPAWVVAPALWNRWPESAAAHDTRVHLRLRLEVLCEAADLDPDRGRAFAEIRMLRNAVWEIQEGTATAAGLTRHVTLIKAFQPA
ncbi:phosphotransferase [Ornithinimicrobium ciconiae]|uniref:Phosphotransferase n=1 Tax=Ornithinimicrobium ciconiae TaxID=2594265 RepID=A0A516GC42_9MICO|nr:aminoglycoside phosphotransferase family protein [Ornithinimicrobium ciconiae]QDO89101.1 phosphotransferase [Ornithinimicrobium ciconiae]